MANRTVSVALVADVGQYQSAMTKAAATTRGVGAAAAETGTTTRRGFDLAGKGALLLGGAVAGAALGLRSAITAASDLNETLNKANVIFGNNSAQIQQWAQGAAKDFGLSQQAALEAAASLGNMFQQLGFTGDQAASASTNVVKLAADLGSFNNLETGDVLERIQSAFRGEYDSLQLLIPNINAARVETEAMAATGKENADALTAQEKAAAVLAIVQKDGAAAANDFAETSDGLANSTKIAAAQFEDLKARIGQDLLPVAQSAMHFLSDTALPVLEGVYTVVKGLAGAFGDLPGPVQAAVVAAGAWALAGGRIIGFLDTARGKFKTFADGLDGTTAKFGKAGAAAGAFARAIGPELGVALAVGGLSLVAEDFAKIANAGDDARDRVKEITRALEDMNNAERAGAITSDLQDLQDQLRDTQDIIESGGGDQGWFANLLGSSAVLAGQAANMKDASESADVLRDAIERLEEKQRTADAATDQLAQRLGISRDEVVTLADKYNVDLSGSLDNVYGRFLLARASVEGTDGAMANANSTTGQFTGQMDALAEAADAAKRETDQFKLSLDILTGVHVSLLQVQSAYQESLDAATNALKDNAGAVLDSSGALNLQSENGRQASDVLLGVRDSGNELISTMIQQGATQEEVSATDRQLREDFIKTAGQMGISREAAEKLADQILGIPSERETKIKADTAQANAAVAETQTRIDGLHGKTVTVSVRADGTVAAILGSYNVNARPGIVVGRAEGGPIPGSSPSDYADNVPIMATAGEFMHRRSAVRKYGMPFMEAVNSGRFPSELARGYAGGGIVVNVDGSPVVSTMRDVGAGMKRLLEPGTRALAFAKSQVGKPYIWGGVGPGGYDCSGFMSAITNVLRGRSPYSRVGSTATFPWAGFAPGYGSLFTIGSAASLRGGVGHMAGTLLGLNVESAGGVGVRVGAGARGADWGYFNTRAHLGMADGGVIGEPVFGRGMWSGRSYSFAERGDEVVLPRGREVSGYGRGGGRGGSGPSQFIGNLYLDSGEFIGRVRGEAQQVAETVTGEALGLVNRRGRYNR